MYIKEMKRAWTIDFVGCYRAKIAPEKNHCSFIFFIQVENINLLLYAPTRYGSLLFRNIIKPSSSGHVPARVKTWLFGVRVSISVSMW